MSHINLFQTNAEFTSAYNGSDYIEPWVSYTMETSGMAYNKGEEPHDYSQDYLTFVMLEDGTDIRINYNGVSMSRDNGTTWVSELTNLNAGDKILVRGDSPEFEGSQSSCFEVNKSFNVEGNIMSLIYEDDFRDKMSFRRGRALFGCFHGLSIISAENLILPATTLNAECYREMFQGCTGLTSAPELPATTMADWCYNSMFEGCASLTTAPALPATTMAEGCYYYMFWNCTSLTTAPELPATTLVESCYSYMFQDCTSLNYIKCLATNMLSDYCTSGWVSGVASTGTFVKDASMTDWTAGSDGIPNGWTVQDA